VNKDWESTPTEMFMNMANWAIENYMFVVRRFLSILQL